MEALVINTASLAGFVPIAETPAYVASKHGVVGLTRSFGMPFHYNKDEITFAAICPHFVVNIYLQNDKSKLVIPTLSLPNQPDKISPEFVAKGVLKILEDKINGSTLHIGADGYHYEELEERFKILIP
ncbi:15-hydroxyprostaglandin dehydrogenase [NAD(+)] like protein [Argiope bruennichi]|uniref:15-hydroxyprostaglandin dehydrogenase [NAD(+)] n=1 Tax=Argiope bruennichi TaxID=94029 RepID=A0A8T0EZ21_ARGBR|nr:15-hydroxyprostaglandin dehydrogenase [NAD(+)] like protein [Argiope bruennichi]